MLASLSVSKFKTIIYNKPMQNNCKWVGIGVELVPLLVQQCSLINTAISLINLASYKFSDTNRPHLNLYDLDVIEEDISDIIVALDRVLKDTASFRVKILKVDYFHFGSIFLEVENHPLLLDLHNTVVSTVYKYKGSCVCKDYLQPWRNYTQDQDEMLKKYGNPFVLKEFHPHISLGFIKAPEKMLKTHVEGLNKMLQIDSFRIEKLSLVRDVREGHDRLATFNLKYL